MDRKALLYKYLHDTNAILAAFTFASDIPQKAHMLKKHKQRFLQWSLENTSVLLPHHPQTTDNFVEEY